MEQDCDTIGRSGQIYFVMCTPLRRVRKLRCATLTSLSTSSDLSVCNSAWSKSAPAGRIFFEILCCGVLLNPVKKSELV